MMMMMMMMMYRTYTCRPTVCVCAQARYRVVVDKPLGVFVIEKFIYKLSIGPTKFSSLVDRFISGIKQMRYAFAFRIKFSSCF